MAIKIRDTVIRPCLKEPYAARWQRPPRVAQVSGWTLLFAGLLVSVIGLDVLGASVACAGLGVLGLGEAWRARAARRWDRRRLEGFCPACGYDVRATPGQCPECGYGQRDLVHDYRDQSAATGRGPP